MQYIAAVNLVSNMQKIMFISMYVLSIIIATGQEVEKVSVEKSVFGIQAGLLGVWVHNELKISNPIALRTEVGISGPNSETIYPMVALEPRWYMNLDRRAKKGRSIDGNSGNYLSLRSSYHFYDPSESENDGLNQLLLAPTYGMRRNLGEHFNYEVGGGIGFTYNDVELYGTSFYVNLRIGYRF